MELIVLTITADGLLDLDRLDELLDERVKLVSLTMMSNVTGTITPVQEIVRRAREVGAATLIDGAQGVPHLPVHVQELGCMISLASASILTEQIEGRSIDRLRCLTEVDVLAMVDAPVGRTRRKCALLPLRVLLSGLKEYSPRDTRPGGGIIRLRGGAGESGRLPRVGRFGTREAWGYDDG